MSLQSRSWKQRSVERLLPLVSLVFLTAVIYANSLPGKFVWIDHVELEQGGYLVRSGQDLLDVWKYTLEGYMSRRLDTKVSSGGYFRPLYSLSISLDYLCWRNNTALYHLENVVWHGFVVGLLFLLGERVFKSSWVAWLAAVWFAIHPLGTHSVTWISGRKDTLCAAFSVLAVLLFWAAIDSRGLPARLSRGIAAAVMCGLAILSKELGFVVPLLGACCLWFTIRRGSEEPSRRRFSDAGLWCLLCLPAVLLWIYRSRWLGGMGLNAAYPSESLLLNCVTSARLFWWYVIRILVPGAPQISDSWQVSSHMGMAEWLSLGGVVVVVAAAIWGGWNRKAWALPLLLFLIWLLPASGLIPLRHFRAERYLYPASWALVGLVVWGVSRLLTKLDRFLVHSRDDSPEPSLLLEDRERVIRGVLGMVAAPLLVWSALVTVAANPVWWSDDTLFWDSVSRDPNHAEAYSGLSALYLERRDYAEAIATGERAVHWATEVPGLQVYWSPYITRNNLGLAYYYHQQPDQAKQQFERLLVDFPDDSLTWYHLGLVELRLDDPAAARRAFDRRLAAVPEDVLAQSNLALCLLRLGEFEAASDWLESLMSTQPDRMNRLNLASAFLAQQRFEEAYPLLATLLQETPNDIDVLSKAVYCLVQLDRDERARALFEHATRIAPNDPRVTSVGEMLKE